MLFDLRGRRKRVIQVAYAILAVLMAGSLFTVVGPLNIGDLFGNGSSAGSSADPFIDQAEKLDRQLRRDPQDEKALAALVRARYNAGFAQVEFDPTSGTQSVSEDALTEFEKAVDAWDSYRKSAQDPNPLTAEYAAHALLNLAQFAATAAEFRANIEEAAAAQAVVTAARPSLNTYFELARLRYFAGDFDGGDEAARRAEEAVSSAQRSNIASQLDSVRQQAETVQRQLEASERAEGQQGKNALENPLGGLSDSGTTPTEP
jgi:hypothetical protein